MKVYLKKVTALALSLLFASTIGMVNVQQVQAAPQTQDLNNTFTFSPSDNPRLNPTTTTTYGAFGINNGSEGASGQTTADTDLNQIYTWRLPDLSERICSNARLSSLRLVANVTASTEGDPDLAALMLYRIDGSDSYNVGNYTVQQGVDYAPATGVGTPPNNEGIYGVVRGTDSLFGGQLVGQLEATWDLTGFGADDTFGIMIQQDSQDGSVDLQTALSTVELTYDDEDCLYDGAITKTLLNPGAVTPGGQAVFEITVTNNGNEPLPFNAIEDRGIYDIASPSLMYQGVSSNNVDVSCQDIGVTGDLFVSSPSESLPYQNHLDYSLIMCRSASSQSILPGESRSFQMTFNVTQDAVSVTNFAIWVLSFDTKDDPGTDSINQAVASLESGGLDMLDLILSGSLVSDNVSLVSHTFTASTEGDVASAVSTGDDLAGTGSSSYAYVLSAAGVLMLSMGVLVIRRLKQPHF
jgi:hypothetical protein